MVLKKQKLGFSTFVLKYFASHFFFYLKFLIICLINNFNIYKAKFISVYIVIKFSAEYF